MTAPDPRLLAEQVIRDHIARIDDGCVTSHIHRHHPELTRKQHAELRDEVTALIAIAACTPNFPKEGE